MTQEALKEPELEEESLIDRFRQWLRANLKAPDNSLKEALEEVLEEHEAEKDADVPQEEKQILKKILNFGELEVHDIMTPRGDIKAVEYNISFDELKIHLSQYLHTRVPVYNDTLDNVKGFLHSKDLFPVLAGETQFNMAFVLRDILFVPPSMKLIDLLVKMRSNSIHIAIVVDEYGGTDGLVTLEDIFEEIVGEIQDEHDYDEEDAQFSWDKQGACDISARAKIEHLEKDLGIVFEKDQEDAKYETLGGFIFFKLGHVPIAGELIELEDGTRLEILTADPRQIKRVRIFKSSLDPAEQQHSA